MKKLRSLFFETDMSWRRVLLFAVATAALTALLLVLPFTKYTSLANIGVFPESWILFALIVVLNCKTPKEAGCKTFIFFLVSQPLIYLLQVPFSSVGWQIFTYYPRWFVATLFCLPGGMIAWYVKKNNILSALILSVANSMLVAIGAYFLTSFPHYFLSAVYCFALAVLFIFTLLQGKRQRLTAGALTLAATAVSVVYFLL